MCWAQNSSAEVYGIQITNYDDSIRFGYGNVYVKRYNIGLGAHIGVVTP